MNFFVASQSQSLNWRFAKKKNSSPILFISAFTVYLFRTYYLFNLNDVFIFDYIPIRSHLVAVFYLVHSHYCSPYSFYCEKFHQCVYVLYSSSPSALHAQLLVGKHSAELFQLAEKQRYDHEYGDSRVYETATQEPVNLMVNCSPSSNLQKLSECNLAQEESAKVKDQQPEEHKSLSWQAPCPPNITHQSRSSYGDHNADCGGRCLSPTHEFSNTQPGEDRHSKYYAHQQSRMDLKTQE